MVNLFNSYHTYQSTNKKNTMLKINVTMPDFTSIEYHSALAPVVGDRIVINYIHYVVSRRTLSIDNPNFIIVNVELPT